MSSSASHIRLKHPGTPFAVEHITFSLCECVIHSAVEYLFSSSEIIEGSIEKKKKKNRRVNMEIQLPNGPVSILYPLKRITQPYKK